MGFRIHLECRNESDTVNLVSSLKEVGLSECWNYCLDYGSILYFEAFTGIDTCSLICMTEVHDLKELLEYTTFYINTGTQYPLLSSIHKDKEYIFDKNYSVEQLESCTEDDVIAAQKLATYLAIGIKYNCYIIYY